MRMESRIGGAKQQVQALTREGNPSTRSPSHPPSFLAYLPPIHPLSDPPTLLPPPSWAKDQGSQAGGAGGEEVTREGSGWVGVFKGESEAARRAGGGVRLAAEVRVGGEEVRWRRE